MKVLDDAYCVNKIADYLTIVEGLNTIDSIEPSSSYKRGYCIKGPAAMRVDLVDLNCVEGRLRRLQSI